MELREVIASVLNLTIYFPGIGFDCLMRGAASTAGARARRREVYIL